NVSNTVADTTRTVSGFTTPAMGVHALTSDAARTLVGEGKHAAPASDEEGLPLVGPLLGSLPIVGGLLGDNGPLGSLPIVGGLLGGGGAGGGLPSVGSLPFVGPLAQNLPVVGGESTSVDEEGLPIVGPLLG